MNRILQSLGLLVALGVVSVGAHAAACATDTSIFVDVPDSASYCTNTQWLKNRAVTVGCTDSSHFCPNDPVTRGSMALFMDRLGIALTPVVLFSEHSIDPFDPTSAEHVCQTADIPVTDFPRTIVVNSSVSLSVSAYARLLSLIHISYDGGTTWSGFPDGANSIAHRNQGAAANDWMDIPNGGTVDINVGQTFRLGVLVARDNETTNPVGSGTVVEGRCKLDGIMFNRNPATAPF